MLAGCGHSSHSALPPATTTSTTARPVTTTTTVPAVTYRVRQGDTLNKIASQHRVSPSSIMALNHMTNPDVLAEGTVLKIPPVPPLKLVVTPRTGTQGQAFHLQLTGAPPNEQITFEVHSKSGVYTGPPHVVDAYGTVSATYQTATSDPAGRYIAVAKSGANPISRATFVVTASPPIT
jgi:LysM repeat protein